MFSSVWLGKANRIVTLFYYFLAAQRPWSLPSLSNGVPSIWLIFWVPDQWNSIIWLIFQAPDQWNSINLVIEILKRAAPLHFKYELGWTAFFVSGTPQQWIPRKKPEKITFKNFFSYLKIDAFQRITHKFLFIKIEKVYVYPQSVYFHESLYRLKLS